MKTRTIGIKELHARLRKISEEALRGKSFLVMKHAKPVFRIEPVDDAVPRLYSLKDLTKAQFKSERKDTSKNIDTIAYQP